MRKRSNRSGPSVNSRRTTKKAVSKDGHGWVNSLGLSVEAVQRMLRRQSRTERERLVASAFGGLSHASSRRDPERRVHDAKVLVAAIPESLPLIERLLKRKDGRYAYEVHFSLFVFFGDAGRLTSDRTVTMAVIRLLIDYLNDATSSTAAAAWMAGHVLGAHLGSPVTRDALAHLTVNGRHAAAREAAIYGLSEALSSDRREHKTTYKAKFAQIAKNDRSRRVRAAARLAGR